MIALYINVKTKKDQYHYTPIIFREIMFFYYTRAGSMITHGYGLHWGRPLVIVIVTPGRPTTGAAVAQTYTRQDSRAALFNY